MDIWKLSQKPLVRVLGVNLDCHSSYSTHTCIIVHVGNCCVHCIYEYCCSLNLGCVLKNDIDVCSCFALIQVIPIVVSMFKLFSIVWMMLL